ncbi:18510_t:CDS:2, partial [Racocetra fulgida]
PITKLSSPLHESCVDAIVWQILLATAKVMSTNQDFLSEQRMNEKCTMILRTLSSEHLELVQEMINKSFNLLLDAKRIPEALELTIEFIDKILKNNNIKKEISPSHEALLEKTCYIDDNEIDDENDHEPYKWYKIEAKGDKSARQLDPDEYVVEIKIQKSSPNKNKIGIGLVKTTKNRLITVNLAAKDPSYLPLWIIIQMFDPGGT